MGLGIRGGRRAREQRTWLYVCVCVVAQKRRSLCVYYCCLSVPLPTQGVAAETASSQNSKDTVAGEEFEMTVSLLRGGTRRIQSRQGEREKGHWGPWFDLQTKVSKKSC